MALSSMYPNTTGVCDQKVWNCGSTMKIISVREQTVSLGSPVANAAISFDTMTASAVVVEIETRKGRYQGLGFSSIGRFSHGGLMRERFIPRLMNATPADLIDPDTAKFSMHRLWNVLMRNEKDGGHGERSGAVGVLETAMWDAWAKSEHLPLWALLQREFGHANDGQQDDGPAPGQTRVYASGGHYHQGGMSPAHLRNEIKNAFDAGFGWFKLKTGGASVSEDMARIHAAIGAAGTSDRIAVDANCAYDKNDAAPVLQELDSIGLRWIEEPVGPLNYHGLAQAVAKLSTPVATGENCFSAADTANLLRYGGLRPGKDMLQMDIPLSYGFVEFMRMVELAEAVGWSRRDFIPHAGHQAGLHASAGLGLGAHETASVAGPFGGVSDDTEMHNGIAILGDAPGSGIENKPELFKYFDGLLR